MKKYKVLVDFELDGANHTAGSEVELELADEVAALLVSEGKLEEVTADADEPAAE